MKDIILKISGDDSAFLENPPDAMEFEFSWTAAVAVARKLL